MRVLIVDDDPAIRDMLSLGLGLEGLETVLARNGREALEEVRAETPDVIVRAVRPGLVQA